MKSRRRHRGYRFVSLGMAVLVGAFPWSTVEAQVGGAPDSVAAITGTISGRFLDGLRPLPHALVEAYSSSRRWSVAADENGRYRIDGVDASQVRLRASHSGHESVTVTVRLPRAGEVNVDLELAAAPLRLEGVEVSARAGRRIAVPDSAEVSTPDPELEVRMLELSPSVAEAGLADAVQALPGNDPSDPSDVLFMRGSTTELKLVLLDGVPVYTPFHVAGLMRSFEPAVLGSADLHVGGAPARYDGGLTHILDLRTRSPRRDRLRASGSVDLLSASVAAETPLGSRAGAIVSARSLHDLGQAPLGGERPYGYRDLLIAIEGEAAEGHQLRGTGFWNEESIRLDFDARPSDAAWRNRAGALTYSGAVGGGELRITAGASRYDATLPLQPTPDPGEPLPEALLASAQSERVRLVGEVMWGEPEAPIRTGLSFEKLRANFSAESLSRDRYTGSWGSNQALGAFVDVTRPVGPGVTLRAGLRGDVFADREVRLSPRATLFWELGADALLSIAAGRYHQVTRTPDSEFDESLSAFANASAGPGQLLPVATADHVVLSLDQRLGSSVSLGLAGFWKRFDGLRGSPSESIRNSGLDVRVLSPGSRATVWVGYGLSWFWSPRDLSGRASEFAGRHLLSAGLSGNLAGPIRGEARVSYGAGLPSTSIPFGQADGLESPAGPEGGPELETPAASNDPIVPGLDSSFLRIDLELHAVFEPSWGGQSWRIRPYLRLLNALDRRDALFYTYQPWRSSTVTPLAERPILPVFGISFSF